MALTAEYFGGWHLTYSGVCSDRWWGAARTQAHSQQGGESCAGTDWDLWFFVKNHQDAHTNFLNVSLQKNTGTKAGRMCAGWYWLHFQMLPPTQDPHRHRSSSFSCCEIRMNVVERKNKKYRQWLAGKEVWLFLASFYPMRTKSFKSQAGKQEN